MLFIRIFLANAGGGGGLLKVISGIMKPGGYFFLM